VTLHPSLHAGSYVSRGALLGRIFYHFWHVHISEYSAGCGFVDPRRPSGPFHDPRNDERSLIGEIRAYVANAAAYKRPAFNHDPRTVRDWSTPISMGNLHGVVDFRASVTDTPRIHSPAFPEHGQTPAVVRGWLAPANHLGRYIGRVWLWDGSRPHTEIDVRPNWAFGTWRQDACYYHWQDPTQKDNCHQDVVWHAAGFGFNTRLLRNGKYQYCVQALTINSRQSLRCARVTVRN
jgi:hypothetical protein